MDLKRKITEACQEIHCDCEDCKNNKDCRAERFMYLQAVRKVMSESGIYKFNLEIRFQHNAYRAKYVIVIDYVPYYGKRGILKIDAKLKQNDIRL